MMKIKKWDCGRLAIITPKFARLLTVEETQSLIKHFETLGFPKSDTKIFKELIKNVLYS